MRHTVNQFDVYVGTSAGSFVAAAVANGITPEEMMRVIVQQVPTPFPDASVSSLLKPNYREFMSRGVRLPLRLVQVLHTLVRDVGQISAVDVVLGLADALPTGLYSAEGIERYVRRILSDPARTNDFRELRRELYVTATDLDSCERVVFGAEGADHVPISKAVSASSALPMIYKPVQDRQPRVHRRRPGLHHEPRHRRRGGGEVHRRRQPARPVRQRHEQQIPTLSGSRARRVSDMGFPQIGYQAFKLIAHQRLHELARRWEERYPGVDIVLIEPDPADELMFQTSVLNFTSRVDIARHGFESVTLSWPTTTSGSSASPPATGSRSRPPAYARWSSTSGPSASRPGRGARSSSRRPRRCCASRPGDSRPPRGRRRSGGRSGRGLRRQALAA